MSWIPCRNRFRAWPYRQSSNRSLITLLLQLWPDGPGNVQSCVVRRLTIRLLSASMVHCIATPIGVTLAPGICLMQLGWIGMAQLCPTSLLKALSRAVLFAGTVADL